MSLMTSGVKIWLLPRMKRFASAGALAPPLPFLFLLIALPSAPRLQNQFLLGRFEIVVVPQLLAGDDLAESAHAALRQQVVHLELAREPSPVELGYLAPHGIDAEARRLAGDIDRAVIHGVAEILAGIAANHHAPALHHEAGERAGVAADDDRAALHVDAGARADIALADEVAAADRRAELRARVLLDEDRPAHHVLGARPADAAGDAHVRSVDQAEAEITERAVDDEVEPIENADAERMLGPRILDGDGAETVLHQLADAQIDDFRLHLGGVDLGPIVVVDVVGGWQREAVMRLVQIDVEERLLRAAAELLGMQPHFMRQQLLRRQFASR